MLRPTHTRRPIRRASSRAAVVSDSVSFPQYVLCKNGDPIAIAGKLMVNTPVQLLYEGDELVINGVPLVRSVGRGR